MKKLIVYTLFMIFIPFFIVFIYKLYFVQEIKLNYIENRIIRVKRLKDNTIDVIPLEEYIVGVLAGEMPISFSSEAFMAQAIASRSYAVKRMEYNKDSDYDVVDSVMNQVYLDDDYLKEAWGIKYKENINKLRNVVNKTLDYVMYYDDEVIDALFFSASNLYTEDASVIFNLDLPYLKSTTSFWDVNTSLAFKSSVSVPLSEFYEKLDLKYSDNLDFEVIEKSSTNRVIRVKINGVEMKSSYIYNNIGLRSYDFSLRQDGNNVVIDTVGYGHGVGMSQYGAEGMAREGYSYQDILKHYYNGVVIDKIKKI